MDVILVRPETSPDDIRGIATAVGVLIQKGGLKSHAAVVTRAMGKACICGAEGISVDIEQKQFTAGRLILKEGDEITIDGSSGFVYPGLLPLAESKITSEFKERLALFDGFKRLGVRARVSVMVPQVITIQEAQTVKKMMEGIPLKFGVMMETAIFLARRTKKEIEIGVCGEQAGEPRTIRYLHGIGVDYVSCSPFRYKDSPLRTLLKGESLKESPC